MDYKLSKGFRKGIVSALTVGVSLIALAGFADLSIWDLAVTYIKPIVGALTVGGILTMVINYLKVRWSV